MSPEGRDFVLTNTFALLSIVDSEAFRRRKAKNSGLTLDLVSMYCSRGLAGLIKGVHLAQQWLNSALVDEPVRCP